MEYETAGMNTDAMEDSTYCFTCFIFKNGKNYASEMLKEKSKSCGILKVQQREKKENG